MPNKLINEKSPYLLQHANNPVDWYPWGAEALNKAKAEDKPIFLSVGYSTCHWCHVMEHESFEDSEVAEILNKNFVAIKVDKEERPDLDSVYMNVCQALTGSGGWPMTIVMTPDQKPFFAGTYFPKKGRYGMSGIIDILNIIATKWKEDKNTLVSSSEKIVKALSDRVQKSNGEMTKRLFKAAKNIYLKIFDEKYGGFGNAPKFPTPHNLMFLLRYHALQEDKFALLMAEKTLLQMYRGGIFDHVGGGFSRYSTDEKWLVPHFEKMLYDNALLVITYLEAYQITKRELYLYVAKRTLEYIQKEMTSTEGGFYCAQDADSEGVEGKYYVFKPEEIIELLGKEDGEYFNKYFGATDKGNFEGANILNLIDKEDIDEIDFKIAELCIKVYDYRKMRMQLHKDDKILTSWNAMMVVAFAKAYQVTEDDKYYNVAVKAIEFAESKLTNEKGELYVRYREGESAGNGYLDDYAFTIWAYLALYEAGFETRHLEKAVFYAEKMVELFSDSENKGFFLYGKNSESLIMRPKETYDGAIPSGNSVAEYVLFKLARLTGKQFFEDAAYSQLAFLADEIHNYPVGHSFALVGGMQTVYSHKEIVCVAKDKSGLTDLKKMFAQKYLPDCSALVKNLSARDNLGSICEFIKDYDLINDKTTYYVCKNRSCSKPTNDLTEAEKKINILE